MISIELIVPCIKAYVNRLFDDAFSIACVCVCVCVCVFRFFHELKTIYFYVCGGLLNKIERISRLVVKKFEVDLDALH